MEGWLTENQPWLMTVPLHRSLITAIDTRNYFSFVMNVWLKYFKYGQLFTIILAILAIRDPTLMQT